MDAQTALIAIFGSGLNSVASLDIRDAADFAVQHQLAAVLDSLQECAILDPSQSAECEPTGQAPCSVDH